MWKRYGKNGVQTVENYVENVKNRKNVLKQLDKLERMLYFRDRTSVPCG